MTTLESSLAMAAVDKVLVAEVVQTERAARDQAQWDRMLACFHPDSRVEISWFQGTGPEFVAASERNYAAGSRSMHQMGPTLARVRGDRALAETGCAILVRGVVAGVAASVTSHSRLHERLERRNGEWRLSAMRIVYQQDLMTPLDPSERLALDRGRLGAYRPSYRFLSYLLAERGNTPSPDLAGSDRPEAVAALLAEEDAWLAEG